MPSLNWIGKEKIVNHDKEVPFRLLRKNKKFSLGNSENLILEGDNLEALKALMPFYYGKIKCIYIDPPYNTGNEKWVYNDRVNSPKIKEWFKKIVGAEGEDLTRHDKWLCMMYPRLKLLYDLLRDDGVIFISIDDNEHCNLKMIMDSIFGPENFVANFMWKRKKEISNDSRNVSIQGEYVLSYSKTKETILFSEALSEEYISSSYSKATKEFPLGKWRPVPLTVSKGLSGGGYSYIIQSPGGKRHKRIWAYPENSYKELFKKKRIYFGKNKNGIPQRVIYDFESKGKPTTNYWDNIATNKEGKKEILEFFGDNLFNTPKPTELIKKIIKISTGKNDIILDSFAGSGTTAHAVLDLNKEDGGNRKFILVELEKHIAKNITAERVKRVARGYSYTTGNGKAVKVPGLGGGFEYVELGEPLFDKDGMISKAVSFEDMARYVYFTETRTNLERKNINGNYLGEFSGSHYFLLFNGINENVLDRKFLKELKGKDGRKIVYADKCLLDEEVFEKQQIIFKQIPYQVRVY